MAGNRGDALQALENLRPATGAPGRSDLGALTSNIAAVRASGVSRRWRRITLVLVLVVLAFNIAFIVLNQLTESDLEAGLGASPDLAWVVAAALTPAVIARRILRHETVTIQTVMKPGSGPQDIVTPGTRLRIWKLR